MVSETARQMPETSFEASRLAQRCGAASAAGFILVFPLIDGWPSAAQDTTPSQSRSPESAQERINRALSAGPASITANATVVDIDAEGGVHVLRPGTNDFTCMPGDPSGVGKPAMCADKVAMQWNKDFEQHKARPSTTVPGIEYMLAGATQRSDSDPFDQTSPPIQIGPHWMILWPFDPRTSGLATTHKPTGAYIMWAGTPWAHVHIMGPP
jgi:hypothetical protein